MLLQCVVGCTSCCYGFVFLGDCFTVVWCQTLDLSERGDVSDNFSRSGAAKMSQNFIDWGAHEILCEPRKLYGQPRKAVTDATWMSNNVTFSFCSGKELWWIWISKSIICFLRCPGYYPKRLPSCLLESLVRGLKFQNGSCTLEFMTSFEMLKRSQSNCICFRTIQRILSPHTTSLPMIEKNVVNQGMRIRLKFHRLWTYTDFTIKSAEWDTVIRVWFILSQIVNKKV